MTALAGNLVTPVGFDSNGNLLPLLLDASGRPIVVTPSNMFSSRLGDIKTGTSVGGASTAINSVVVPAGKIYQCTSIGGYQTDTVARSISFAVVDSTSGNIVLVGSNAAVAPSNLFSVVAPNFVMYPGDYIQATSFGLANTKTLVLLTWFTIYDLT